MLSLYSLGFSALGGNKPPTANRKIKWEATTTLQLSSKIIYDEDILFKTFSSCDFLPPIEIKEYIPPSAIEQCVKDGFPGSNYNRDMMLSKSADVLSKRCRRIFLIPDDPCPTCIESSVFDTVRLREYAIFKPVRGERLWHNISCQHHRWLRGPDEALTTNSTVSAAATKTLMLGTTGIQSFQSMRYPQLFLPTECHLSDFVGDGKSCLSIIEPSVFSRPLMIQPKLFESFYQTHVPLGVYLTSKASNAESLTDSSKINYMHCYGVGNVEPKRVSCIFSDTKLSLDFNMSSSHKSNYRFLGLLEKASYPFKCTGDLSILPGGAELFIGEMRRSTKIPYIPSQRKQPQPPNDTYNMHCCFLRDQKIRLAHMPSFPILSSESMPISIRLRETSMSRIQKIPYFFALHYPKRSTPCPTNMGACSPEVKTITPTPEPNKLCAKQPAVDLASGVYTVSPSAQKENLAVSVTNLKSPDNVIECKQTNSFNTEYFLSKHLPEDMNVSNVGSIVSSLRDTESRVKMFLQVHKGIIEPPMAKKPPQTPVNPILILPIKAVSPTVQTPHSAMMNVFRGDDVGCMQGFTILVSETMLDTNLDLIIRLNNEYGIESVDGSIDPPVNVVVDMSTGVAIIGSDMFDEEKKNALREWMFMMTKQALKYATLWIIIVQEAEYTENCESYFKLRKSLMNFPCVVCTRQSRADGVAFAIFKICKESSIAAAIKDEVLPPEYIQHSKDLINLSDPILSTRSVFLQQFPTINMHLAVSLLAVWPIRQLLSFFADDADSICRELGRMSVRDYIRKFLTLIHCYVGYV